MAFVELPGGIGKIYVPDDTDGKDRKHPCPDCFYCQWCSETRCRPCRDKETCRDRIDKK